MKRTEDILLLGDQWTLNVFHDAFLEQGVSPRIEKLSQALHSPPAQVVTLGNGDTYERLMKTMGEDLGNHLWNLSEMNFVRAKEFFLRNNQTIEEEGLLRWKGNDIEEDEKAFSFDTGAIEELFPSAPANEAKASLRVILSDRYITKNFKFFWDKLIPVTLSTFEYSALDTCPEFSMSLHNQGTDFAIQFGQTLNLGSYRNLYEDKAVGEKTEADPVSKKAVAKYFGDLNWINPLEEPKVHLSLETLSCDGLPVIGTLPEAPNTFIVSGFSSRTANFIFEVAHQVAKAILTDGKLEALSPYSLKRLS